jgi:hypothetical protein
MDLEVGLSRFPHLFHLFAGSPFVPVPDFVPPSHSHPSCHALSYPRQPCWLTFLLIPLYGLDTMLKPRRRSIPVPFIVRRRLSILILVVLFIFVLNCLPSHNKRVVVGGKWLPDYDVEERPRYLHHSSYRHSPDYAFERRVSDALERIEQNAIVENSDLRADDRIWQIRLGNPNVERGHDSLQFEEKNREWEYTVRSSHKDNRERC